MTKKYIFKQVAPEYQDSYFEECYKGDENLIFINNRNVEVGELPDFWLDIIHNTAEIAEEVVEKGDSCTTEEVRTLLIEWFPYAKEHIKSLTTEKLEQITDMLYDWGEFDTYEVYENLIMLEVVTGSTWNAAILRGYNQRDWIQLYYNTEVFDEEHVKYIEDSIFNMGSEWISEDYGTIYVPHFEKEKEYISMCLDIDVDSLELLAFGGWIKTPKYKAVP